MMEMREIESRIRPTRVVHTGGRVIGAERLLEEKNLVLIPGFAEHLNTGLIKEVGEEDPFVVLDFGRELAGGIRMVIGHMNPNDRRVRVVFGESVTEVLTDVGERGSNNPSAARDITVPMANLSIRDIGRQGFRFVKIQLVDDGAMWLKGVIALSRMANLTPAGYLRTSDERLNAILDTAAFTAHLCVQEGVIWDGIKRDRLVWAGDLNTELLALSCLYGDIAPIRNSLNILADETPEDVWMNGIPTYSAWWVLNVADVYRLTGDTDFTVRHIERINHILRDLDVCIGETDTDFGRTGQWTDMPFFLDWPTFGSPDAMVGAHLLIDYTLGRLVECEFPGVDGAMVEHLRAHLVRYRTMPVESKAVAALQVLCGSASLPDRAMAERRTLLEADGARGFSTFMSYFLLSGLEAAGSRQVLDLARTYYGGMLDRGATTFWEDFSLDWLAGSGRIDELTPDGMRDIHADTGKHCYEGLKKSLCHGWSVGILPYFVEHVLGITPAVPGFGAVRIDPHLGDLAWAEGCIPTPHGPITVRVEAGQDPMASLPDGVRRVE